MANAEGSDNMLNRVMPKDNIGLAALLRTKEAAWDNGEYSGARNQFYLAVKSNSWVYEINGSKRTDDRLDVLNQTRLEARAVSIYPQICFIRENAFANYSG